MFPLYVCERSSRLLSRLRSRIFGKMKKKRGTYLPIYLPAYLYYLLIRPLNASMRTTWSPTSLLFAFKLLNSLPGFFSSFFLLLFLFLLPFPSCFGPFPLYTILVRYNFFSIPLFLFHPCFYFLLIFQPAIIQHKFDILDDRFKTNPTPRPDFCPLRIPGRLTWANQDGLRQG